MTRTIHEIWSGVLAGDTRAWTELVDLYSSLVFTIARRAGLDEADAEDCAQFTWISLYRRRRSIRDPVALPAWLIRTTHRRALTLHQRRGRRNELESEQPLSQPRLPDELVSEIEQQALLEIALSQLDPRCRRLLDALYLAPQPLSYQEIARDLRIKPNSLGPLRSRCLQRLKKILENLGWQVD